MTIFLLIFLALVFIFAFGSFFSSPSIKKSNLHKNKVSQIKALFLLLSIGCFLLYLGENKQNIPDSDKDIFIILDISESMLSQDMEWNGQIISRLDFAKRSIVNLLEKFPQHEYSLILFAYDAKIQVPLTHDISAFRVFLDNANPQNIPLQGTRISQALSKSYQQVANPNKTTFILVSDGGEDAIEEIETKDIDTIIFGVGSQTPTPIPLSQDAFGNTQWKIHNGEPVHTTLNIENLKKISKILSGEYHTLQESNDLQYWSKKIIDSSNHFSFSFLQTKLILYVGLVCFLIFFILHYKKYIHLYHHLVIILCIPFFSGCSTIAKIHNEQGIKNLEESQYFTAEQKFKIASNNNKIKDIATLNQALSLATQEKYQSAIDLLTRNVPKCNEDTNKFCSEYSYTLGNSQYREGENKSYTQKKELWESAIASYQTSLSHNPENIRAQENKIFVEEQLKKLKENPQNQNTSNQESSQKNSSHSPEKEEKSDQEEEKKENNNQNQENTNKGNNESDRLEQLSPSLNKEIEEYMQQLEEQEKSNQKYFQNQNPSKNLPFPDHFANDPFFQEFFDIPTIKSPAEKDW